MESQLGKDQLEFLRKKVGSEGYEFLYALLDNSKVNLIIAAEDYKKSKNKSLRRISARHGVSRHRLAALVGRESHAIG